MVNVFLQQFNRSHRSKVFAVHTDHPHFALTTLLDSGASHSIIRPETVSELGLAIKPPTGQITSVVLADGRTQMPRMGTVEMDLHIFFLDSSRDPVRLHLRCEIMPLRTDLLLGVEALRALFPNDCLTQFFIPPSLLLSRAKTIKI